MVPLLAEKLAPSEKQAVIVCAPGARAVVCVYVALPVPSRGVAACSVVAGAAHVPPSINVMLPVGVAVLGAFAVTVPVKATDSPKTVVLSASEEVTTVVVGAAFTVSVVEASVAGLALGSAGGPTGE